jgi:hypothetical protein
VEVGLSLLAHACMPLKFWYEAFSTTTYLINCLPSCVIEFASPFEKLFHTKPDYTWRKTFECGSWPHLWAYNTTKLEFWSKKCVFLGYSSSHKGYKCLDIDIGQVYVSLCSMKITCPCPIFIQMQNLNSVPISYSFLPLCATLMRMF